MHVLLMRVASFIAARDIFSHLLTLLESFDQQRANILVVLTYHRVDVPEEHPSLYPGLISATPELFDQQMSYLAANYQVVSLMDVLEARRNGQPLPSRAVLITFDDAYSDFAEHAWPTLKWYGLPVTLFVPTGFPDAPERVFWWDAVHQAVRHTPSNHVLTTPVGQLAITTTQDRNQAYRTLNDYIKTLPPHEGMAFVDN